MRPIPNMIGLVFGRLTVVAMGERMPSGAVRWQCRCECGRVSLVGTSHLKSGYTKSCGCLQRDVTTQRLRTHGLTGTPTYASWVCMWERCSRESNCAYAYYGGRGIRVCDRWNEFENFLADMGIRPPGTSLDRINGDGHYEPGNCRWATRSEQALNKRGWRGRRTLDDRKVSIREMAHFLAMSKDALGPLLRRAHRQ